MQDITSPHISDKLEILYAYDYEEIIEFIEANFGEFIPDAIHLEGDLGGFIREDSPRDDSPSTPMWLDYIPTETCLHGHGCSEVYYLSIGSHVRYIINICPYCWEKCDQNNRLESRL